MTEIEKEYAPSDLEGLSREQSGVFAPSESEEEESESQEQDQSKHSNREKVHESHTNQFRAAHEIAQKSE